MLSLTLNQKPLTLRPGTTVSLQYNSPAFAEDVLPANFTYQLVLPLDANRQALDFPDLIENIADVRRSYDQVTLEDDGVPLVQRGRLVIRSVSERANTITTIVSFGLGLVIEALRTRTLAGFEFGGKRLIDDLAAHANATVASFNRFDYVFAPLYNPHVLGGVDKQGPAINAWVDIEAVGGTFRDGFYCPWPKLRYVLRQVFAELSIPIREDFFDAELSTLVLLHNWLPTDAAAAASFRIADLLPAVVVKEFLLKLGKDLGILFQILPDGQLSARLLRDVLAAPEADDWTAIAWPYYESREVSELEGRELTYNVEGSDNIGESVRQAPDTSALGTAVATFTDLPVFTFVGGPDAELPAPEIRLVQDTQEYFRSEPSRVETTNQVLYNWQAYVARRPTVSLFGGGSPLAQELTYTATQLVNESNAVYGLWPAMAVPGNNPALGVENKSEAIRLAFFRGRQPYLVTTGPEPYERTYPLVSPFNANAKGERIGEYSLQLDGPDGTYERLLKYWLEVRYRSTPVKYQVQLSATQLLNLDFARKVSIQGNRYLIQQISVTAPIKEGATVTLIPLPKG